MHLISLSRNSSNAKPADLDTRGYSQAIHEQSVLADAIGFNFARDSGDNSTGIDENTFYEGPFTLRKEDPSTRKNLEDRTTLSEVYMQKFRSVRCLSREGTRRN